MIGRVLIVEDDRVQALSLRRVLEREGHHVEACSDMEAASEALASRAFDIVLTDLWLGGEEAPTSEGPAGGREPTPGGGEVLPAGGGGEGLALFRQVREALGEEAPTFVILTAYGTVESARAALRSGVYDYITKPVDPTELANLVGNVLEYRRLRRENHELSQAVAARRVEEKLIGQSVPFLSMIELAKAAAGSEATILIRGESGTGKELVAELIHAASPRAKGPFVKVNCGAIPEPLLEAELFGHEQGAFTDARQARKGRFELAQGGTIFLDEIGEMSPALQVKLLRVLQERELERLGGQGQVIPLDLRLLAATNRDLEEMIRGGGFREDLYYRINVITIHAPPLRERRGDIELLANAFCARFNEKNKKSFRGISPPALELLRRYHWPGNVRELENVIERAVVLGRGESILPEHLPDPLRQATARRDAGDFAERVLDAGIPLEDFSRLMVQRALEATSGNVSQAARKLGLTRRTLQYRLGKETETSGP